MTVTHVSNGHFFFCAVPYVWEEKPMLILATVLALTLDGSFAERVEEETGHFCERRHDGSIGCWPGKVERADGVYGTISVDMEDECLRISFPDETVCGLPEGSHICEYAGSNLICYERPAEGVDWAEVAARYNE